MSTSTAVIFVDPYNEFLHPEGKLYPTLSDSLAKTDAIDNMRSVLEYARNKGIPVFYCLHQQTNDHSFMGWQLMSKTQERTRDDKVFRSGTFSTEYFKGMEPDFDKGDVVVSKHWNSSSFVNTDLDYQLRQSGVRRLIFAGMVANSCLESTARYAYELGYEVNMLSDATAAFEDEARLAAVNLIWPLFATRVMTTKELVTG